MFNIILLKYISIVNYHKFTKSLGIICALFCTKKSRNISAYWQFLLYGKTL